MNDSDSILLGTTTFDNPEFDLFEGCFPLKAVHLLVSPEPP
jgi:hypothetical protein